MTQGLGDILRKLSVNIPYEWSEVKKMEDEAEASILALVPEGSMDVKSTQNGWLYRDGFNACRDQILKNFGEPQ